MDCYFHRLEINGIGRTILHGLGGLSWGEWASIIAIITFLAGLISLLFKYAIFGPFRGDIKELNQNFTLLNHNLAELKSDISRLDRRADEHDRRLDRHHEKIKNLKGG